MNKNKILYSLLVLGFPLSVFSMPPAQDNNGWQDHGQRIERLSEELGLNADQKSKVEAIFNNQKNQIHCDT